MKTPLYVFSKSGGVLCQGIAVKYAWIKKHRKQFPVAVMCRILQVSSSGYYEGMKRQPCLQLIRRRSIAQAAAHSYFESNHINGYRKVHDDLINEGVPCCKETVRRVMRDIGLFSRIKRKFVVTTDSNHLLPRHPSRNGLRISPISPPKQVGFIWR